jgi:hypothetical protein
MADAAPTPGSEAPPVAEKPSLQGLIATREDRAALLDALEKAFDYRGDCTITTTDARTITGYIFDRRRGAALEDSYVRVMLPDSDAPQRIAFSTIDRVEFSGKDPAHGKTFERWVQKYIEKKLAGQRASIESESLD